MASPLKKFTEYLKNQEKRSIIAIIVTFFIIIVTIFGKMFVGDYFKRQTYDILVSSFGGRESAPDKKVILLLIDELSMEYGQGIGLGNWPWSRSIYSNILSYVNMDGKARAIFFDILFTESDKDRANDEIFQEGIANSGNIYQNILLIKERDFISGIRKIYLSIFELSLIQKENNSNAKINTFHTRSSERFCKTNREIRETT